MLSRTNRRAHLSGCRKAQRLRHIFTAFQISTPPPTAIARHMNHRFRRPKSENASSHETSAKPIAHIPGSSRTSPANSSTRLKQPPPEGGAGDRGNGLVSLTHLFSQ